MKDKVSLVSYCKRCTWGSDDGVFCDKGFPPGKCFIPKGCLGIWDEVEVEEVARWNIGMKDMILVGELHCQRCGIVDVRMGGIPFGKVGDERVDKCPKCKEVEGNYWVNMNRDWENRKCLFIVDEVAL